MCVPIRPEEYLAYLIRDKLGVDIDPRRLRSFILDNWKQIKLYAHQIHENNVPTSKAKEPEKTEEKPMTQELKAGSWVMYKNRKTWLYGPSDCGRYFCIHDGGELCLAYTKDLAPYREPRIVQVPEYYVYEKSDGSIEVDSLNYVSDNLKKLLTIPAHTIEVED